MRQRIGLTIQVAQSLFTLYVMQDYARPVQGLGQGGDTVLQELLCQGMSSPTYLRNVD